MVQKERAKPEVPGFLLRMPKAVDDAIRQQATEQGMSINNIIVMHLAHSLGERVKLFKRGKKTQR